MRPSSRLSMYLKRIDVLFQTMVTCVLTLFVCALALPTILLLGFVFHIHRSVAVISAQIFKKGQLAKPLTLLSSTMANLDQLYTSPFNTLQNAMILEGVPDMQKIRDTVKQQLLERLDPKTGQWLYPEMLQNISYWMGYPFWRKLDPEKVNPDWFLKECVYFYENDEMLQSDFRDLEQVLNKLSLTPFSKDKPLIEVIILPKYTPHPAKNAGLSPDGTYFVAIVRVHHALADGFSLFKIGQNLSTDMDPDQFQNIPVHDYTKQGQLKSYSIFGKFLKNFNIFFKLVYEITELLIRDTLFASKSSVWPKDSHKFEDRRSFSWETTMKTTTPIDSATKRSHLLNEKRLRNLKSATGSPFNISDINEIKKLHGVSGTAVLFSALIGTVRKTLFSGSGKGNVVIPPYIGVSVPLPLPGRSEKLRNRYALGIMYIPLFQEDAVKRLHKVQKRIKLLQKSTIPIGLTLITTLLFGQLPRWALLLAQKKRAEDMETLAVTNMAGPKTFFDFGGYPMRDFFFGSGIPSEKRFPYFCLASMGGRAKLIVISDSAIIGSNQQAEELANNFSVELEILREAGKQRQQLVGTSSLGE